MSLDQLALTLKMLQVFMVTMCHTLISSRYDCLSTFGFLPTELSCLTLIAMQSARFCDVLEGNGQDTQNGGKMVILGIFSSPWVHLGH